jgi:hypothetical protein
MANDFSSTSNSQGLLKDYYENKKTSPDDIAQEALRKRALEMQAKLKLESESK